MKSFYWIIAIILIFVGFIGVAAFVKNGGTDNTPLPTLEVMEGEHILGSGKNILIEYSDFQCPACRSYFPVVEEFLKQKGGDVTFVYRNFPLAQHLNAYPAAQAAEAASNQGKFFEMYRKLFEGQDEWAELSATAAFDIFKKYAGDLNLDMAKFEADYALKDIRTKIQTSYKGGVNLGVNQTPTFYLNGKKLETPPQSLQEFLNLVGTSTASTTPPLQINSTRL